MAAERGSSRQLRDELVTLAVLAAASVLVDPVQRRNARAGLERALRSVRDTFGMPAPRLPTPFELSSLHEEARRITREAAPDGQ